MIQLAFSCFRLFYNNPTLTYKVINCFYILNMKYSAAVDRLREEIGYEEAHINRIRNKALYHYTVAEFGLPEL